jgi:cyclopropane-fatty-acyl-phospholipid synthase
MIYKFKSKATGDLIMTQPVGERVLSLIGKPVSAQGIIEVDQMPAAIGALESAVAAESPKPADGDDQGSAKADAVSLRQRVWPMVEMMKRALAEKQPIVWGA